MSADFVAHYNILDRSRIDEVTALMQLIDEKYGAEAIVGSPVKPLEVLARQGITTHSRRSLRRAAECER